MEAETKKDNSKLILAFVLIGIGIVWILKRLGIYINFPEIHWYKIFEPIRMMFHNWGHFIFSWQMIFIIIGLILLAGKRSSGIVFIIVGGFFILPKIFFFPGLTISLFLPVLLIGIGIAIVLKRI